MSLGRPSCRSPVDCGHTSNVTPLHICSPVCLHVAVGMHMDLVRWRQVTKDVCCRILDNLPVAMVRMREGQGEAVKTYERGFPVGRIDVSAARTIRVTTSELHADDRPESHWRLDVDNTSNVILLNACAGERQVLVEQPPAVQHLVPPRRGDGPCPHCGLRGAMETGCALCKQHLLASRYLGVIAISSTVSAFRSSKVAVKQLSAAAGWQVVPFSVQHAYEGSFNEASPELSTCNPGSMKFVTNKEAKQEVAEGKEVIFTYDVLFLVSCLFLLLYIVVWCHAALLPKAFCVHASHSTAQAASC